MSRRATFEVYRDSAVASNGNIIADSGEGYSSKQGAERGIESVKRNAADAEVEFVEED